MMIAGLAFTLTLTFETVAAQSVSKIPIKDAVLIASLIEGVQQPDAHTADDVYLKILIGQTAYLAELMSGKVISQERTENASGGFYREYAEVSLSLLNKDKQETTQGAAQIMKFSGGQWYRIALSEGDYQCSNIKTIPKTVLKALKVECN